MRRPRRPRSRTTFAELGRPDVPSGEEIQSELENAASEAGETFEAVKDEVDGEIDSATDVAVVAGAIAEAAQTALTGIQAATNRLQELDVEGTLSRPSRPRRNAPTWEADRPLAPALPRRAPAAAPPGGIDEPRCGGLHPRVRERLVMPVQAGDTTDVRPCGPAARA